jgi:putative membrane protein
MKIRALAIISALALPTIALAQATPTDTTKTDTSKTDTNKTDTTKIDTSKSDTAKSDTTKPDMNGKSGKLSEGDTKIVAHLHHVNQMEIDVGKAAQKSGTASVKSYASNLVTDHQMNDKDLTSFAKSHKLATIPADKPESDADKQDAKEMTSKVAHLKTLKGADFDREFLNMMATDHDKELAKIDVSIGAATDPDLQSMLKSTKPVLQRHADQARDLQKNPQASTGQSTDKQPTSR